MVYVAYTCTVLCVSEYSAIYRTVRGGGGDLEILDQMENLTYLSDVLVYKSSWYRRGEVEFHP